jgi:DNA (cytosine-5)-methyltransferase 1
LQSLARPICMVEIERFCTRVLEARFPGAHMESDVRAFSGELWRDRFDLLCAGFPCQPFSTASRGRRTAIDLWPEILRVVAESRAPMVFLENVQREPIYRAAQDLHALGYRGAVAPLSSAQVGAPHDRRRWWLLAHTDDTQQPMLSINAEVASSSEAESPWDALPSGLLGMDDGVPDRMARLRALGNAVVPACARAAFVILLGELFPTTEPRGSSALRS